MRGAKFWSSANAIFRHAGIAGKEQSRRRIHKLCRCFPSPIGIGPELLHAAPDFAPRKDRLITQSVIERQAPFTRKLSCA